MKIMISYYSKERPIIQNLARAIETMGFEVWFDEELVGGELWWTKILKVIRDADVVIAALSANALASYPCRLEREYARNLNKTLLPLQIAENFSYQHLPFYIQERQILKYLTYSKHELDALQISLSTAPMGRALPNPLPAEPPVPIKEVVKLKDALDAMKLGDVDEQLRIAGKLAMMMNPIERKRDPETANYAYELLGIFLDHPYVLKRVALQYQSMYESYASENITPPPLATENFGVPPSQAVDLPKSSRKTLLTLFAPTHKAASSKLQAMAEGKIEREISLEPLQQIFTLSNLSQLESNTRLTDLISSPSNTVSYELQALRLDSRISLPYEDLSTLEQYKTMLVYAYSQGCNTILCDGVIDTLPLVDQGYARLATIEFQKRTGIQMVISTCNRQHALGMATQVAALDKNGNVLQVGSPLAIYEKPFNIEVAKLCEINLFEGQLMRKNGKVLLDSKVFSIELQHDTLSQEFLNTPIIIGIRPDHIHHQNFIPSGIRPVSLEAICEWIDFAGAKKRLQCEIADIPFVATVDSRSDITFGRAVKLVVDASTLIFFDARTQIRLHI